MALLLLLLLRLERQLKLEQQKVLKISLQHGWWAVYLPACLLVPETD